MVTERNKFDILQETSERHNSNDEYKNFIATHIEVATECILTKLRVKCKVPWEWIAVRDYMKKKKNL